MRWKGVHDEPLPLSLISFASRARNTTAITTILFPIGKRIVNNASFYLPNIFIAAIAAVTIGVGMGVPNNSAPVRQGGLQFGYILGSIITTALVMVEVIVICCNLSCNTLDLMIPWSTILIVLLIIGQADLQARVKPGQVGLRYGSKKLSWKDWQHASALWCKTGLFDRLEHVARESVSRSASLNTAWATSTIIEQRRVIISYLVKQCC